MEAALQLLGLETAEPFRGECPACHAEVVAFDIGGREVVCEVAEVLPSHRCPQCEQVAMRNHRRSSCARCADTGYIGETIPLRGVAVDADGNARAWSSDRPLLDGEAIHAYHACDADVSHL